MPCVLYNVFRQCQIRDTCYFNTSFWWLMKVLFNLIYFYLRKLNGVETTYSTFLCFFFFLSLYFVCQRHCCKGFIFKHYLRVFACSIIKMSSLYFLWQQQTKMHKHAYLYGGHQQLLFKRLRCCYTRKIILTSNNLPCFIY